MVTTSKRRVKAADINGVTSLEELQENIVKIGLLQNKVDLETAAAEQLIGDIKSDLADAVKSANDEIKVLSKSCQIYFTANQGEFVPPGKKSVIFDAGKIGTRTTPLSVTIKKAFETDLIKELKARNLKDCIKETNSVNKDALKKVKSKVEDIPGIKFNQREEFFIEPNHLEAEHLENIDDKELSQ